MWWSLGATERSRRSMRSPSLGGPARNGPLLLSTEGRMVLSPGERCHTMNTAAGRSAGKRLTTFCSASMPPAEAPMTTMSLRAMQVPSKQSTGRRPAWRGAPLCVRLGHFVHRQDDAFALARGRQERRAHYGAADALAAAVGRLHGHFARIGLSAEAGADRRA